MTTAMASTTRRRNLAASVATLFVILLVGLFSWRVVYFSRALQNGELPLDTTFAERRTLSQALAALPVGNASVNLATDDDPTLGSEAATLTIVEFADFSCPYSQEASHTMRALAARYGEAIRYVYRDFPLADVHPQASSAAAAAECAQEQGKFWEYHDKLYSHQDDLSVERLQQFAQELNLDVDVFSSCVKSGKYSEEVLDDYRAGVAAGVRGTPTFFINGYRIPGAIPEKFLDVLIKNALGV